MPHAPIYHRWRFQPKTYHNQSMVGRWPLAPHHDHLQYIHHVHLMQRGQNRGVTFPSPFNSTVLSAYKIEQNATLAPLPALWPGSGAL